MKAYYNYSHHFVGSIGNTVFTIIISLFLLNSVFAQERPAAPVVTLLSESAHAIHIQWERHRTETKTHLLTRVERSFNNTDNFVLVYATTLRMVNNYHDIELRDGCGMYYYRVQFVDDNGPSDFSEIIVGNSNISTPINFRINTLHTNSTTIALEWQPGSIYLSGFKILRAEGSSTEYVEIADLRSDIRSYMDVSVTSGVRYNYRLYAYGRFNNCISEYASLSAATGRPIIEFPLILALKRIIKYRFLKNWNDIPLPYTHWIIERSDYGIDKFQEIGKVMGEQFSFEDPKPLEVGTSYYRVIAMEGDKVVAISKEISTDDAEEGPSEEINIYPNPFKDNFTITSPQVPLIENLKLLSEKGVEATIEWKDSNKEMIEVYTKETLEEGVYYLHIHRSDTKDINKIRLVKTK